MFIVGVIMLLSVLFGGYAIADHYRMDFVQGLVLWLLCTVAPYGVGWIILKIKAPFMLIFYEKNPYIYIVEIAAWFIISLIIYAQTTSYWLEQPSSGIRLMAASVFAIPITLGIGVALALDKRVQEWALKETFRLSGINAPPVAPDVEWKPPAPPPSGDANTFDPDRFKRD